MSENLNPNVIRSHIWTEEPETDNSFAARAAYCHGYDVYGEMLGQARWVDMLYLLFKGEAPSAAQAALLETLAVALANPGPRDASVHAAMCGGTCGATAASSLMAALAVGAGNLHGGHEVQLAIENWQVCGVDLGAWKSRLQTTDTDVARIWEKAEHVPGFDPNGVSTTLIVRQTLACLAQHSPGSYLSWLGQNRAELEELAGRPLSMAGVAAAAFADLGFSPAQGEMCHLLLRLPGAAAHALEQREYGHKKFPFYAVELEGVNEEEQQ